jgi:hypothetical protein
LIDVAKGKAKTLPRLKEALDSIKAILKEHDIDAISG